MPGLIGKKIGMTSVFSADGKNIPCTVIEVGPCVVTQIKTMETDGYEAVQVGFQEKKEKHTTKPLAGHFKKAGVAPQRHLAEFKSFETVPALGEKLTVELFTEGGFVPGRGETSWFRRCRSKHTRPAQPSPRSGFDWRMFVSCKGVQRSAHGRPDGQRARYCPKPSGDQGASRAQFVND